MSTDDCAVNGCTKKRWCRDWCNGHYKRWLRYGHPEASPTNPISDSSLPSKREPSYRYVDTRGYVRVRAIGHPTASDIGWAMEHRMVAYDAGLLTDPDDPRHVHHINHDKADNRPENLEVLTRKQHARKHSHHYGSVDWDDVVRLYESGRSAEWLAEQTGTHASTVHRRLRDAGVRVRSRSEASMLRQRDSLGRWQGSRRREAS